MTTPIQTFGSSFSFAGVEVAHVMDMSGPGETAESEDITNHSSPQAYREKIPVILDGGELTFDLIYISAVGQDDLRAAFEARTVDECIVAWPVAEGGGSVTFDGFVSSWNWATPVAGTLRASIGITVSGPVTVANPGS